MAKRSLRPPRPGGCVSLPEGAEEAMKEKARKSSEYTESLTTERLCDIWEKTRSDAEGRRALERLDEAGFPISHLTPNDATFKRPCWADYVAALPLLPNRPSTRRIHSKTKLRKYWPLVRELRRFAATANSPFAEVRIFGRKDDPDSSLSSRDDLLKAATTVEDFLSWDYCVHNLNPRHALIAELRWTIRQRTGKPHDRELNVLIDAAFRAAGYEKGCFFIDSTTLDRIEKRQMESRVKAHQRIRRLMSTSSPSPRRSTRIRRNSRKRV
jgi:hypothetical protein